MGVFITCEYAVSLDEHEIMTQHDEHVRSQKPVSVCLAVVIYLQKKCFFN